MQHLVVGDTFDVLVQISSYTFFLQVLRTCIYIL